jgi:hypothetical protein
MKGLVALLMLFFFVSSASAQLQAGLELQYRKEVNPGLTIGYKYHNLTTKVAVGYQFMNFTTSVDLDEYFGFTLGFQRFKENYNVVFGAYAKLPMPVYPSVGVYITTEGFYAGINLTATWPKNKRKRLTRDNLTF